MRPIALIVPMPPGGAYDSIARLIGQRMSTSLGQPIIIENVAGANGSIGVGRAARAIPDGYTLTFGGTATHVYNGALMHLQYDIADAFEPISLVSSSSTLMVGRKTLPARDLRELIAWLRVNPDRATLGTTNTSAQLLGTLFQKRTSTSLQFVPYRGAAPAIQDMLANQIDLVFDSPAPLLPQVKAENIRAYAVAANARFAAAPDIPTVDEAGLPGLYMGSWYALFAPQGTPKNCIEKLNLAVIESLGDTFVRQRLRDLSQVIPPREQQTPGAVRVQQKADIEKWWPIIKEANIRAE